MGTLWRSEEMHMVQLFVQSEASHDTVEELGKLGLIEFVDLNPDVNAFQRHFVSEVRRMEELARKLRFFHAEVTKAGLNEPAGKFDYLEGKSLVIEEMETQFEDLENDLKDINRTYDTLNRDSNELVELKYVLEKTADIFQQAPPAQDLLADEETGRTPTGRTPLLGDVQQGPASTVLGFVAGVIDRNKIHSFERLLWRTTRGNLFMKDIEIEGLVRDPQTGEDVQKNVVVIFFQGSQSEQKIRKICDARGVHIYPCPETTDDRDTLLRQVDDRLREMRDVLGKSRAHRDQLLRNLAAQLRPWQAKVAREKAIYDTLNLFNYDLGRKCLVGVGWCPVNATSEIQFALRRGTERSGALTHTILSVIKNPGNEPPTYFKTNKVQAAFQTIVEAYGVARYREINPTPLTVVTFPFLFAIMFGDLGHGTLMTIFAALLIIFEKKIGVNSLGEMGDMVFSARYMLLGMGAFSMYVGLLYNEAFAVGMDLFGGSRWHDSNFGPDSACAKAGGCTINGKTYMDSELQWCEKSGIYPIGMDPAWKGVPNEIAFYNSLKMKVSILFGVVHMTIGIIFSAFNARFFKQVYDFRFVFIPSIVLFLSMFGYLSFLIVLKWIVVRSDQSMNLNGAMPKIMNIMIDMFLSPGSCCGDPDHPNGPDSKFLQDRLYNGQEVVQWVLFLAVLACVPVMLCAKPFFLWRDHKQSVQFFAHDGDLDDDSIDGVEGDVPHAILSKIKTAGGGGGGHGHGDHFDMSEIVMHQVIHAIEFILGAISNTASYLRLWALSLAHAELAVVFWERGFIGLLANTKAVDRNGPMANNATTTVMVTPAPTSMGGGGDEPVQHAMTVGGTTLYSFIGMTAWLAATIGVLMVMEALSAFLHALRLHWVEFQNKFYAGDGHKFMPFSFQANHDSVLKDGDDE